MLRAELLAGLLGHALEQLLGRLSLENSLHQTVVHADDRRYASNSQPNSISFDYSVPRFPVPEVQHEPAEQGLKRYQVQVLSGVQGRFQQAQLGRGGAFGANWSGNTTVYSCIFVK